MQCIHRRLSFRDLRSFPTRRSSDLDLLHFYAHDFYAPGFGMAVENGLHAGVELVAMREKVVEFSFADDGAQGGERKSTRLNSSHSCIPYVVSCLIKKSVAGSSFPVK